MSQLLYKYFLQKTNLDHLVTFGDTTQDPYFEEIPEQDLHFYQRKGAKRKRRLPDYIPKNDLKILNKVKSRAYTLDLQLSLCGLRIGWAGVIGLIPWIGDIIALYFAMQLVRKAKQIEGGLPKALETEMMANVMFDFGIGLIPIVGDFINVLYKCNSRNFVLLEKHLVKKYGSQHSNQPVTTQASTKTAPSTAQPTSAESAGIGGKKSRGYGSAPSSGGNAPESSVSAPPYSGRPVPAPPSRSHQIGNEV